MGEPENAIPTPPDAAGDRQGQLGLRTVAQLTGVLGALFAVLFLISLWVIATSPGPKASDQELVDFYASDETRRVVLVGLYLLPFAAVAFLWFLSLLREWVLVSSRGVNRLLSNVQLGSGVAFITLAFAAAAASTVVAAGVEFAEAPIDPGDARQFTLYGDVLLFIFAMRMAAIFMMTTTSIGRHAGVFPRWFTLTSYALAAFLFLSATLNFWLVLVFPLWVLALGGLILFKARQIPRDLMAVPAVRSDRPLIDRPDNDGEIPPSQPGDGDPASGH
jgi:hypothetical protein